MAIGKLTHTRIEMTTMISTEVQACDALSGASARSPKGMMDATSSVWKIGRISTCFLNGVNKCFANAKQGENLEVLVTCQIMSMMPTVVSFFPFDISQKIEKKRCNTQDKIKITVNPWNACGWTTLDNFLIENIRDGSYHLRFLPFFVFLWYKQAKYFSRVNWWVFRRLRAKILSKELSTEDIRIFSSFIFLTSKKILAPSPREEFKAQTSRILSVNGFVGKRRNLRRFLQRWRFWSELQLWWWLLVGKRIRLPHFSKILIYTPNAYSACDHQELSIEAKWIRIWDMLFSCLVFF